MAWFVPEPAEAAPKKDSTNWKLLIIEKLLFPILSTIISATIVGFMVTYFVNTNVERWKSINSLKVNREAEAVIECYDSFQFAYNTLFDVNAKDEDFTITTEMTNKFTESDIIQLAKQAEDLETQIRRHSTFLPVEMQVMYFDFTGLCRRLVKDSKDADKHGWVPSTDLEQCLYCGRTIRAATGEWHQGKPIRRWHPILEP